MRKVQQFLFIITLFGLATSSSFAQRGGAGSMRQPMVTGSVKGVIVDSNKNQPIPYATIIVFSKSDSSQVSGGLTNDDGIFEIEKLRPGNYFLEIKMLGYENGQTKDFKITNEQLHIDLSKIDLSQSLINLEGITVSEDRPAIEYKIDKKVINVAKHYTATSGSAVEVLENVPSVEVDFLGNVSLRGSSNFQVLIDGRPSILEATDALQQIPASAIENIEIITNPSAKYDPDGTSGIINILMKKNKLIGLSGNVSLNIGEDDRYGGNVLLNYRNSKYNAYVSFDYNKRPRLGTSVSNRWTIYDGVTNYLNSEGSSTREHEGLGLRGGIDFYLSEMDNLSVGFRVGDRSGEHSGQLQYDSWDDVDNLHNIYSSSNSSVRSGGFYAFNMDYLHKFDNNGHQLLAKAQVSHREGDEESSNQLTDSLSNITFASISLEEGPSDQMRFNLDYTRPFGAGGKFELGYQGRMGVADDLSDELLYDTLTQTYIEQSEFHRNTEYEREIHSVYTLFSGERGKFGYQGGLRAEYTYRDIIVAESGEHFNLDRWDYYPTFHLSYSISESQQFMTSYTRRLRRSRGWYFEPFETRVDAFNIRVGNPELEPQFVDSYEAGYQRYFGASLFSIDAYYRVTHNKIEFIKTIIDANTTLNSVENVGKDYSLGTEIMLRTDLTDFWDISNMLNLYNYRVEGTLNNLDFSTERFSWSYRMNNTFGLSDATRLQFNASYRSGSSTSQGETEGMWMTSMALKHDFIPRQLSATLQVQDLLGTMKRESYSEGVDFYSYDLSEYNSPTISLNFTYLFNNFKPDRKKQGNGEDFGEDDF